MESTSSGRYRDYPPASGKKDKFPPKISGKSGERPLRPARDYCRENLTNVRLEEVARCDFYTSTKAVPAVGSTVRVRAVLVGGRIAVETTNTSVAIGFLPTTYNYIRKCLAEDFSYEGKVVDSTLKPLPAVSVDLNWSK